MGGVSSPSIAVRSLMADIGLIQVDLRRADEATADHVIGAIEEVVQSAASRGPAAHGNQPAPNLADAALRSLEAFPLDIGQTL